MKPRLELPIHAQVCFVLVRPHYPENVGACARAIKTMGFSELLLVKPSRLAVPEHEMAFKMAVRSWDVLYGARRVDSLAEALVGVDFVVATSSHRGISGVLTARQAAQDIYQRASQGQRAAVVFGNEKTGLAAEEIERATRCLRIPMAADQPSINLAQAVQLVAYELFVTALEARGATT